MEPLEAFLLYSIVVAILFASLVVFQARGDVLTNVAKVLLWPFYLVWIIFLLVFHRRV
jgi:hypothetical protein